MSDEQYPPVPPPPPHALPSSQRFPTWKQACVMFGGGLALWASACFGFLFVLDLAPRDDSALAFFGTFLMVLVPVGLLVTFFGGLLVLTRILHALFGRKDETPS
jgi:hypothetical protein